MGLRVDSILRRQRKISKKDSFTSRNTAKLVAQFALNKKAEDIVILDMRKLVNFCDYFVICSGSSDRQVKAISDGIQEDLAREGMNTVQKEGMKDSIWIVHDLGDVVIHIFQKAVREFYKLEYLWQQAKQVTWLSKH